MGSRMKVVNIMAACSAYELEREINDFLENHTVTDIQYQLTGGPGHAIYSAMVIYEG